MRGLHIFARASVAAVALFVGAQAHAEPVPQIAGVAADMTLDAARAASPAVQWQVKTSTHTGKPNAIWADAAFNLEGQPYRLSLQPFPSGSAHLRLTSHVPVESAQVCRARVVALAAHFEAFFDKMAPRLSPLDAPRQDGVSFTYNRLPEGGGYVSATPNLIDDGRSHNTLDAGRNAKIHEIEFAETRGFKWKTGRGARDDHPYALDLSGAFYKSQDNASPSACSIEATVTRYPPDRQWPGRPSFDQLDVSTAKLVKPSAAVLHNSLDGVELPAGGVSLAYRCTVQRSTGRLTSCAPHERAVLQEGVERAARDRLMAMKFDPAHLDPDNDLPLKADITIKLLPGERLKAEALKDIATRATPAVASPINAPGKVAPQPTPVWTQLPTSADLSRHYPADALRNELQARVVATCRIAEDLSLACVSFEINPPEHTMFEAAAKRILALYRAAPKLKDGKDAVGTVLRVPILFKIADEMPAASPAPPPP